MSIWRPISRTARLGLVGSLAAAAVVACAGRGTEEASSSSAVESAPGPSVFATTLGQCELREPLPNPALALPLPEDGHPLPTATTEQILTRVDLTAQFDLSGAKPELTHVNASLQRGADRGQLTFSVGAVVGRGRSDSTPKRAYEYREIAGPSRELVLGDHDALRVDLVELWWENNGAWVVFYKQRDPSAQDFDVVAAAASCTFDQAAWNAIKGPECTNLLYFDGGAPLLNGDCNHSTKEFFDRAAASDDGTEDAGQDGGDPPRPPPSNDDDEDAGAATTQVPPPSHRSPSADPPRYTIDDDAGSALGDALSAAIQAAIKAKKEQQSGCTIAHSPSGPSGSEFLGVGALALATLLARRRRA